MAQPLLEAAALLRTARSVVALTGAGLSTPSGIPDFRSAYDGLWNHVDPLEVASLWGFHDDPGRFYRWLQPLLQKMLRARPNPAHRALAQLEADGCLQVLITQNIDSLHQAAGSRNVLELHGHIRTLSCLSCGHSVPGAAHLSAILGGKLPPPCALCGGLLKPDVVLFGEPLPYGTVSAAQQAALACDLMLIAGTSLEVMPAADLPLLARRRGARLVLINLTPTALDPQMDVCVRADVTRALTDLHRAVCG